MQQNQGNMQKDSVCIRSPPLQPSPASGGGSRPSSPFALIPLHTKMLSLVVALQTRKGDAALHATRACTRQGGTMHADGAAGGMVAKVAPFWHRCSIVRPPPWV